MLMATAISQLAEKTPGKESIAIESFAHALRQVIKRIVYLNFSNLSYL
jgi:tRNA G46 methylase TrmB